MNNCSNCGNKNNFSCSNLFCHEKGNIMNDCIANNYSYWKPKNYKILEKSYNEYKKEIELELSKQEQSIFNIKLLIQQLDYKISNQEED